MTIPVSSFLSRLFASLYFLLVPHNRAQSAEAAAEFFSAYALSTRIVTASKADTVIVEQTKITRLKIREMPSHPYV